MEAVLGELKSIQIDAETCKSHWGSYLFIDFCA